MPRRRAASLAAVLSLALAACDDSSESAAPTSARASTTTSTSPGGEGLLALGYVDYSQEEVGPSGGEGVVLHEVDATVPGYNLLTSIPISTARLFDGDGWVVKEWQDQNDLSWNRTRILEGGDLLVVGRSEPASDESVRGVRSGYLGFVKRLGWSGETLWSLDITAHHDISVTPSGELPTLTERTASPEDHRSLPGLALAG